MKISMPAFARVVVPLTTRAVFLLYACLAGAAFREARRIFDKDGFSNSGNMIKKPISFCTTGSTIEASYEDGAYQGEWRAEAPDIECMDATLVANIVPVTTVLSLAAICLYVLMDLVVRGRAQCFSAIGGVSAGVAAGFGAALSILLLQSMWGFLTIGFICDHYEKTYASVEFTREGQSYNFVLPGNKDVIRATGAVAALSCVLTAIDAASLFRTSRAAAPANDAPTMRPSAVVITGGKGSKSRWKSGRGRGGKKCKTGIDLQATGDVEAPAQQENAHENAPAGANPFLAL